MQRSSIIATVVAAGGVLVAGSVASVAVINAASTTEPQAQTITLVADEEPTEPTPAPAVTTSEPGLVASPSALPSVGGEELPEIPAVEAAQPAQAQPARQVQAAPAAPAQPTKKPKRDDDRKAAQQAAPRKPKATSSAAAQEPEVREVSAEKAVDLVLAATGGGVAKSVEKDDHAGYAAWKVKVLRHDGSEVTGYVARESGVVYDWVVDKEAPAPQSTQSSGSSGENEDHEGEHESEGDDD